MICATMRLLNLDASVDHSILQEEDTRGPRSVFLVVMELMLEGEQMSTTKLERIQAFLIENSVPDYRFRQITHAIFEEGIGKFESMGTIPRELRVALRERFGSDVLSIKPVAHSESEQVEKVLFELSDGRRIEAVRMKYKNDWESFCISSQAGCGLACAFCATGAIGFKRNLTPDEITDQVLYFHLLGHNIDSISFMGMGEPLANPQVFPALQNLTDKALFRLSPRRITVSTVGVIPGIRQLTEKFPQVNLVFSLHSPFNEQRNELVPLNRRYPIDDVIMALDDHIDKTHRQVSIAYLLIRGVNDTDAHAQGVISLLKARGPRSYLYHVNVIRYNPAVGAPREYASPDRKTVDHFISALKSAGINVTLRQSFGVDVDAACGQLYARYQAEINPLLTDEEFPAHGQLGVEK